jgi:hypothetical protein
MKASNLWRIRYDELLINHEKLKEQNKVLKNQLISTVSIFIVSIIYFMWDKT